MVKNSLSFYSNLTLKHPQCSKYNVSILTCQYKYQRTIKIQWSKPRMKTDPERTFSEPKHSKRLFLVMGFQVQERN